MEYTTIVSEVRYAGFWKRTFAYVIDNMITGTIVAIVYIACVLALLPYSSNAFYLALWSIAPTALGLHLTYFAISESSSCQATLGKRLLKLKVVDCQGNQASYARAFARHFASTISFDLLYVGILMMLGTKRKQCLHDLIANCMVIEH